jgi:hypothetical protein
VARQRRVGRSHSRNKDSKPYSPPALRTDSLRHAAPPRDTSLTEGGKTQSVGRVQPAGRKTLMRSIINQGSDDKNQRIFPARSAARKEPAGFTRPTKLESCAGEHSSPLPEHSAVLWRGKPWERGRLARMIGPLPA